MATLTEKQEAVKEVLGSTDAIRKLVQKGGIDSEGVPLEDLRRYISNLNSVVTALEEEAKEKVIEDAKALLEKARSILALKHFEPEQINEILGIGNPTKTSSSDKPKKSNDKDKAEDKKPTVKYKFEWIKEDGIKGSITRGTKGAAPDASMIPYMREKGYFAKDVSGNVIFKDGVEKLSLQAWVKAENLQQVEANG